MIQFLTRGLKMSYSFLPLFAYQREKEPARVFLCHRGCQQNPEHGTFRNIPEHSETFRNIPEQGKLSQNKQKKKERKRLKRQPKNERTNKQTKFKKGLTVVDKTSLCHQFYHVIFYHDGSAWPPPEFKKNGLCHIVTSESYQICDKDLQKNLD